MTEEGRGLRCWGAVIFVIVVVRGRGVTGVHCPRREVIVSRTKSELVRQRR